MDILLPDIHMLMLSLPSSWDPATETIQSQTSWSVASGPGWGGATVVVVVDMLVTRVVVQLSRNSDNILIMLVLKMQLLAEETKYSHTMMNRWSQYVLEVTYVLNTKSTCETKVLSHLNNTYHSTNTNIDIFVFLD